MADNDRIAAEVELNLRLDAAKNALKKLVEEIGLSMEEIATGIEGGLFSSTDSYTIDDLKRAFSELNSEMKQTQDSSSKAEQGLTVVQKAGQSLIKGLNSLGAAAQTALGVALGQIGYQAIMKVVDAFKQAVIQSEDFVKSIYTLEVAIRALQRSGVDITFEDTWKSIQKMRTEFTNFSTADLVEGRAQMLNLTRELDLGMEKVNDLIQGSSTLAVVSGKNISEVQRTVALVISSGYTEGLQRLGIAISRTSIALKAQEMGLADSYNALTESERALATYEIIMEQVAKYSEDAAKYQLSLAGSIDKSKASLQDSSNLIGSKFLPLWSSVLAVFSTGIELAERFNFSLKLIELFGNTLSYVVETARDLYEGIKGILLGVTTIDEAISNFADKTKERMALLNEQIKRTVMFWKSFDEEPIQILGDEQVAQVDDTYSKIEETIAEHLDNIDVELQDFNQKQEDLARDLQRDLEKIERDGQRKREELARDYANKISKIDREYGRDVAKAGRDLQYDLAKLQEDQRDREAELAAKYRDKEIEAEARHAEELRKLRARLLFDVEEAARVRDAAAARRAVREYQLNKQNEISSFNIDKEARARDYARELQELRNSNQDKRQELLIAYQQKLEDLRIQREIDKKEAQISYKEDLEELQISLREQREERWISYREQLEDQKRAWETRLRNLAAALAAEYGMTVEAAQAVAQVYAQVYGQNGIIDQIMQYYMDLVKQSGKTSSSSRPNTSTKSFGGGAAEGGTFIATKPTSIDIAERGAEVVSIKPLNYRGSNENRVFSDTGYKNNAMGGKILLDVQLSPELEGKIVQRSVDTMGNVLVNISRRK